MKKLIYGFLLLLTAPQAYSATTEEDIIQNTIVKHTYSEMQQKPGNSCEALTTKSVHWFCTGAIFPAESLELRPSGCGFSVQIKCSKETAIIDGNTRSVFAIDSSGIRSDIKSLDLGFSFSDITIVPEN